MTEPLAQKQRSSPRRSCKLAVGVTELVFLLLMLLLLA